MSYSVVEANAEYAIVRCPKCMIEAKIQSPPGPGRASTFKALREVRGCECPIGQGGTAAVIPGMAVYRKRDGKKFQVADVQPLTQQIRVIDSEDDVSGWMDVCHFSRQKEGTGLAQYLERLRNGLTE